MDCIIGRGGLHPGGGTGSPSRPASSSFPLACSRSSGATAGSLLALGRTNLTAAASQVGEPREVEEALLSLVLLAARTTCMMAF